MSTRARKIRELPSSNVAANGDFLIIEKVSNSSVSTTSKISVSNFKAISGPYANDSAAANNGIAVSQLYYTSSGEVRIRIS